jgi:capsular exopolysaccharide synthesis family protein
MTVDDPDPIMAARTANAFAKGVQEEIEQSQMVQRIYIVDEARVPGAPIKPNTRMNVTIALALGFMAAIGLAFLLEYLDTTIRTPDDLVRRLGGPVLATVPHIVVPEDPADKGRKRRRPGLDPIVVMQTQLNSSASEAFRVLRANLKFLGLDQPLKSILVTSATPSEGKSVTSANLAVAFAQAGEQVCIIDADLRLPAQAKLFGADGSVGLTNVLMGTTSLEEALQFPLPEVALLASGPLPPNPSEMLGSKRMAQLLEELQHRFDIIIVDSVPTVGLADAVTLAPQVSGVLMVVKSNGVSYHEAIRAKEALLAVKANLLGMILDGIHVRDRGYYYRKYYKYGYERRKVV